MHSCLSIVMQCLFMNNLPINYMNYCTIKIHVIVILPDETKCCHHIEHNVTSFLHLVWFIATVQSCWSIVFYCNFIATLLQNNMTTTLEILKRTPWLFPIWLSCSNCSVIIILIIVLYLGYRDDKEWLASPLFPCLRFPCLLFPCLLSRSLT